jgi:hypothetical protein
MTGGCAVISAFLGTVGGEGKMVTIEQVELLESKVSRAIEYVKRMSADNVRLKDASSRLASENNMLHGKLDGYQKRIAELEKIILGFKKDQERIEQGIISALNRLNHFEDAIGGPSDDEGAVAGHDAAFDADTAGGRVLGSGITGNTNAATFGTGTAVNRDETFDAGPIGNNDPLREGDVLLGADTSFRDNVARSDDGLRGIDPANDAAAGVETGVAMDNGPLSDADVGSNDAAAGTGLVANCDRVIGDESDHSASAMVRPVPQPPSLPAVFDREIAVEEGGEVAFRRPETADNREGEPETANDMEDIDGDEFLDLLRDDESAFDQTVVAFRGDAVTPSHDTLEKPANGPELDIF